MKIAFSGTHGTGKTTRTLLKAVELKKEYPHKIIRTLYEVAADCPFGINKDADDVSQTWIFSNQIKYEIEQLANADILICDRSIADCLAYTRYFNFKHLSDSLTPLVEYWLGTYEQIYLLQPDLNNYCFNDGIREFGNDAYRKDIHEILQSIYYELNIPVTLL
jgi:predicted ATPase